MSFVNNTHALNNLTLMKFTFALFVCKLELLHLIKKVTDMENGICFSPLFKRNSFLMILVMTLKIELIYRQSPIFLLVTKAYFVYLHANIGTFHHP